MDVRGRLLSAKEAYELTLASWVPSKPSKFIHKSMVAEPDRLHNSFFLESTTQSEIVEIILSVLILRLAMIRYLCGLLKSLLTMFLSFWLAFWIYQLTQVLSGDKRLLSNYRPVSVLPVFSKFLEKAVYNRLIRFFDKYEILYNNQYGFRKKRSTSLALLYLHDKITSAIDERKHTAGFLLDLSKAFDTVNHRILLDKLEHFGIRGLALAWIKCYLYNRHQYVEFNGISSSFHEISCGLPQGSALGLLF